jgi:hypothetical protein
MDVYLTREALLQLQAVDIFSRRGEGLLIGHKRGHRFFVEYVLAVPRALTASAAKRQRVKALLEDSFLGHFCFAEAEAYLKRALVPGLVGTVLLVVDHNPAQKSMFKAYTVEFDGTYRLAPLNVKLARVKAEGKIHA